MKTALKNIAKALVAAAILTVFMWSLWVWFLARMEKGPDFNGTGTTLTEGSS